MQKGTQRIILIYLFVGVLNFFDVISEQMAIGLVIGVIGGIWIGYRGHEEGEAL